MHDHANAAKVIIDWAAATAGIAAFFDAAPKIAGVLSMIWLSIQLFNYFRDCWKARNGS